MNAHKDQKAYGKWILGIAAICILIYLGVQNIGVVAEAVAWIIDLFTPLLLGIAFALIVNVPMRWIESHLFAKAKKTGIQKLRRPLAIILAFILILGILACVFGLVIPALINALKIFVDSAKEMVKTLSNMTVEDWAEVPLGNILVNIDWQKPLKSFETFLSNQSGNIMNTAFSTITSVLGGMLNVFIALIFSVYILFNKATLKAQARRLIEIWLPKPVSGPIIHAASVASGVFRNFVAGQTLESVILGILCIIGMLILQIPYAPMIGALISVTALVPIVGPIVGTGIGALMICTESPIKAIIFVVFMLVLQQLEGNLIYPKVMGSSVNLPAMWVLAAVTIGGGLAGAVGMLLGVPVVSTIYILLKEATDARAVELKSRDAEDADQDEI